MTYDRCPERPYRPSRAAQSPATSDGLTIATACGRGVARVSVRGELDLASAPIMALHVRDACNSSATALALDFTHLRFCDSSGLNEVITAANRCTERGMTFKITGTQPNVRRVFEITGLIGMLEPTAGEQTAW